MSLNLLNRPTAVIGVYWTLLNFAVVGSFQNDFGCKREARAREYVASVPCDILQNSFCETSGDNYPWRQIRQFVFENQAMMKRMYGYEKHEAILKDEFNTLTYDEDDIIHHAREKYSKKANEKNNNKENTNRRSDESDTKGSQPLKEKRHTQRSIKTQSNNANGQYVNPKSRINLEKLREITKYGTIRISHEYSTIVNAEMQAKPDKQKDEYKKRNSEEFRPTTRRPPVYMNISHVINSAPTIDANTPTPPIEENLTLESTTNAEEEYAESTTYANTESLPTLSSDFEESGERTIPYYSTTPELDLAEVSTNEPIGSTTFAEDEDTTSTSPTLDYPLSSYDDSTTYENEETSQAFTDEPMTENRTTFNDDATTIDALHVDAVRETTEDPVVQYELDDLSHLEPMNKEMLPEYDEHQPLVDVEQVTNSNRRESNGKRPAVYGESRQPSRTSYIIQSPEIEKVSKVKVNKGNKLMWQRTSTTTESSKTTVTEDTPKSIPPPPTPSSIPVPYIRTHSSGFSACPVETGITTPYWANNTRGEPRAILNLSPFDQFVHWERCRFEYSQMDCRSGCRCEQQYRLHRMLAFDPFNDCRGVFSDWFKFPSGCICKCYTHRVRMGHHSRKLDDDFDDDFQEDLNPQSDKDFVNNVVMGRAYEEDDQNERESSDLTEVYFESEDELGPNILESEPYGGSPPEMVDELETSASEQIGEIIPKPRARARIDDEEIEIGNGRTLDAKVPESPPPRSLAKDSQSIPKARPIVNRYTRVIYPSTYQSQFDHFRAAQERLFSSRNSFNKYTPSSSFRHSRRHSGLPRNVYRPPYPQKSFKKSLAGSINRYDSHLLKSKDMNIPLIVTSSPKVSMRQYSKLDMEVPQYRRIYPSKKDSIMKLN